MAAVTAVALGVAGLGAVAAPASAATGKVLILGSTVYDPGGGSMLAQKFVDAGKTVTVVDDGTWSAMSTSDFADYDAIVLGDPACSYDPATAGAAAANAATWGAAVDGNVVVIGSDETYHFLAGTTGPEALMAAGANFAVAEAGKTGAYISLSCYYEGDPAGTPVPLLDGLGSFTATDVGCTSDAHIVATHPALSGLTDADLSNWFCSVHEGFDSWPLDFEVLAIAKHDGATWVAPDGTVGTPYILARGVEVISDIDLTPTSATNPVGTSHELTATVTDDSPAPGTPVVGTTVTFSVIAGPHMGQTGTDTTDSSGVATWSYTGTTTGTDTIVATFVDGAGATQTSNKATKTWEAALPHETATTYTGKTGGQYSDPVPLSANLKDTTDGVPLPGKTIDFIVGPQNTSAGPTDASGNVSTSLTLNQLPGGTSVFAGFAGDAGYKSSYDKQPFTVAKEDCTLAYSGDTLVSPATATHLAADLGEPDSSLGDRSGKTVTFNLTGVATGASSVTATTDGSGHAATTANLLPDVYDVSVSFAGDAYYLGCKTPPGTLVTVQAAGAKVTGGGWVSPTTGRTNFGFNAIPVAGGWKGQLQIRSNSGKNLFHSGNISLLTSSGNTAKWSGTGTWNGVTGYKFTISVVDNGASGSKKLDTISILIQKPDSSTQFTTGGAQTLKGGNITVHK